MEELKVFENEKFGKVRTLVVSDEPWFVGKDVAEALGYAKPENAVASHVSDEDKTSTLIQGSGSNYKSKAVLINESGLYSLIFGSKLPSAKEFKRWVTSEVLPAIRKNGGYIAGQDELTDVELLSKALLVAQRTLDRRNLEIEELKPKAFFADAVSGSINSIPLGDLAKFLKQNGIDIGRNRMMEVLRESGFLIKRGSSRNLPTQKAMNRRLFEVKESVCPCRGDQFRVATSTLVTGNGQRFFVDWFLKNGGALNV